jgi:hypothetical protein
MPAVIGPRVRGDDSHASGNENAAHALFLKEKLCPDLELLPDGFDVGNRR